MTVRTRQTASIALTAWLLCAAASAQDASPPAPEGGAEVSEARARFELGRTYYETGRFLEAAREFEAAIEITPLPALYFNLFLAYRDAGEDERSIGPLRLYIGTLEDGPRRRQLASRLAVIEARVAGEDTREAAEEAAQAAVAPSDPPARRTVDAAEPSVVPWVLVGAGGLLAGGALVTGLLSLDDRSTLDDLCPARDACPAGYEETQARGQALAITTDVLWITGAAALGVGLIWALVEGTASSDTRVAFGCDGHGCAGALQGAF